MNQTDQKKVIDAGFLIFRKQDDPKPIIKCLKPEHPYAWRIYERFETKAARDRKMTELLKNKKNIED
ncbi:hypothetical protein [Dysgonomonas capnocytophagoides]|uniref:hypothetical protein n=1 Tax=Dysgonomonas capnocytophagoides TaxID=45254 RepID=UPI00333E9A0F